MALVLAPFGFSVTQISWVGALGVIIGAPIAILFGVYLDKTRAYKMSLIISSLTLLLFSVLFPRALNNDASFLTAASYLMVFCSVSLILSALCTSFSVEVTYPLNASIINGTMQMLTQVVATALAIGGTLWMAADYSQGTPSAEEILAQQQHVLSFYVALSVCYLLATTVSFAVKEDLRRTNHAEGSKTDDNFEEAK